jgi:hypothetical protein
MGCWEPKDSGTIVNISICSLLRWVHVWSCVFPTDGAQVSWSCMYTDCIMWQSLLSVITSCITGILGSLVSWGSMVLAARSLVLFPIRSTNFTTDVILPSVLWPWGWLSSYQNWVPGIFPGVKGDRRARLTTSQRFVNRLSRKSGIFGISTPYNASTACYRDGCSLLVFWI